MTNNAALAIDALRRLEIDTLFCIPGIQNDDFFDHLVDASDIRPIVTRHEQGAAYMAMGHSQVTGDPSAFCVVPGPGMLNTTAALTSAYWSGGRVLGLIGAVASFLAGQQTGALHDMQNPAAVLEQVTKHTGYVSSDGNAVQIVQAAINALMRNEARPVTIEWPADLWGSPTVGALETPVRTEPTVDPEQVRKVADLLSNAARPLIVVGGGAQDASPEVKALAERLGAPVFTRRQGHGVLDARHPLWVPLTIGHELWADADVVLGIGTRLEFPLAWGVDDDLTIIQLNIDANELDRHGLGFTGLHADAGAGVRSILDALPGTASDERFMSVDLTELRRKFVADTESVAAQKAIMNAIRDVLPDDGIIVEDVTQLGFAAHFLFEFRHPRTFLTTGPAGTLGAGVAHAIGAQVAAGDRKVLGLIGDGGFLFTAGELATAAQYNIGVTLLLHDNGMYGNVNRIQTERFGPDRTIASTLENPDFVAFGKSFGIQTQRADSAEELRPALAAAFAHDGPSLIVGDFANIGNPWPFLRMSRVRGHSRKSGLGD